MDAVTTKSSKSVKICYKERTEDQKKKLLTEKDKRNTQAATDRAVFHFTTYLSRKQLPNVETYTAEKLNEVLIDYYCAVQPQNKKDNNEPEEHYSVQTMKYMRAAFNRHFRKEKGYDIAKDSEFVKANEMFKAVCVESKRKGKGVKRSMIPISSIDLERIAEYFCHDHLVDPNRGKLQQNIVFYILYFFCRRGCENVYEMKYNTFDVVVESDGTEYIVQAIDEMDKNQGPDDTEQIN